MLVDLPKLPKLTGVIGLLDGMISTDTRKKLPYQVSTGLYVTSLNYEYAVEQYIVNRYPFSAFWDPEITQDTPNRSQLLMEKERYYRLKGYPDAYGVVDFPEQLIEKHPVLTTCPETVVAFFTEMNKAWEPEEGGWRWHKWGPYIGDKTPTREYLYDEPEIDRVFVYHIYEVEV